MEPLRHERRDKIRPSPADEKVVAEAITKAASDGPPWMKFALTIAVGLAAFFGGLVIKNLDARGAVSSGEARAAVDVAKKYTDDVMKAHKDATLGDYRRLEAVERKAETIEGTVQDIAVMVAAQTMFMQDRFGMPAVRAPGRRVREAE